MARNVYDAPVKKGRGLAMLGVVGVAAVVLIGGVLAALGQQRTAAAERWTPQGPECPVWEGPLPVSKSRPDLQSFDYAGVTLGRWFGHANCVELYKTALPGGGVYQACHFTGPDFVRVKVGDQETTYRPGVGKPAIVTIRDGVATCATDPRAAAPAKP
ncbi:hypothetical protein [Phenylobacterium sp.]|jgi:hypothetical protein|uniref:hypothetical protein n=1 Tax=Phenylobacterium sp. TaxID=1871053 RepID=UPI002632F88E|nr:hypothetical protein [Phenylobacterium sp.]